MPVRVIVRDETATGRSLDEHEFLLPVAITVRELIQLRVREEVARYNLNGGDAFVGLVQPADAEASLNGYRMKATRTLDWEKQAEVALNGFAANAFFVVVGDRQIEALDEVLALEEADCVSFVRLIPLIGG